MITDPENGNRVSVVPVNLLEGNETDVLTVNIVPEISAPFLRGTVNAAASIMGRVAPDAFQDIALDPLDLSGFDEIGTDVELKVVASSPLPGVYRILLNAGISRPAAAAWLA